MSDDILAADESEEKIRLEVEKALRSGKGPLIARFLLALLSGALPIVGGVISGGSGWWSEKEQEKINKLFEAWLHLQQKEIEEIAITLYEVMARLDWDDPAVQERVESKEYLSLVRKAFRDWSAAESEEKRQLIRNLLSNAGAAAQLCTDDVIRMFINWIDMYDEAHFKVIRTIYNNDGLTRGGVWRLIHGVDVAENSAEADLFKLLFRDLSMGGVIRQHRATDRAGNFLRQPSGRRGRNPYMASAFDDDKPYELTELGKQFVHYTMNEIVPRIAASKSDEETTE